MNHTRLPNEVLLPDWALYIHASVRRNRFLTK